MRRGPANLSQVQALALVFIRAARRGAAAREEGGAAWNVDGVVGRAGNSAFADARPGPRPRDESWPARDSPAARPVKENNVGSGGVLNRPHGESSLVGRGRWDPQLDP